jgi:hypothetical protein
MKSLSHQKDEEFVPSMHMVDKKIKKQKRLKMPTKEAKVAHIILGPSFLFYFILLFFSPLIVFWHLWYCFKLILILAYC